MWMPEQRQNVKYQKIHRNSICDTIEIRTQPKKLSFSAACLPFAIVREEKLHCWCIVVVTWLDTLNFLHHFSSKLVLSQLIKANCLVFG